jgi:hypothetical protein
VQRPLRRATLLIACFASLLAPPAAAGEKLPVDLFAGYSYLDLAEEGRHGVDAALGFALAGPVSGFLDASAHWASVEGVDLSDWTLMAGPGMRFGKAGGTVFFVRALAGLVSDRASITILDVDIGESSSRFGVLAGGGMDLRVSRSLALRIQGDYLWNDAPEGASTSGFRAAAGVVYRFGLQP